MRAVCPLLLPLLLGIASAGAQPADGRIGRIAPDGATSKCIGANSSPTCLTETLLACFARGDAALCRSAGVADPRGLARAPSVIEYVIDRVSVIRAEDVPEDLREVDWFKPGYTLVELRRRSCPPPATACEGETWDDLQVYMRPRENAWELVAWRGELESESAPDIPESFQAPAKGP